MTPPAPAASRWLLAPLGGAGISAALAIALAMAALAGALAPLERGLAGAMAARPLPAWYFLLFILLGALLPLVLRWLHRRQPETAKVLDPYLVLLAGQILTEGLVTRVGGKGLGVLVGMVFTLIRLWQLKLLWPLACRPAWLRRWLILALVLWGGNALQMLAFRWWPLLT
ncbi:MAG: hypothetical protein ACKO28_04490 [Cyanobium sp.]